MPLDVVPIRLRVPRHEIAYVKFVIESYEGVAVTRTVDPRAAVVVALVAPDFLVDARRIVSALAAEGACEEIATPAVPGSDWLGPEPGEPAPSSGDEMPHDASRAGRVPGRKGSTTTAA
jgi:hypothetical protein